MNVTSKAPSSSRTLWVSVLAAVLAIIADAAQQLSTGATISIVALAVINGLLRLSTEGPIARYGAPAVAFDLSALVVLRELGRVGRISAVDLGRALPSMRELGAWLSLLAANGLAEASDGDWQITPSGIDLLQATRPAPVVTRKATGVLLVLLVGAMVACATSARLPAAATAVPCAADGGCVRQADYQALRTWAEGQEACSQRVARAQELGIQWLREAFTCVRSEQ